MSSTNRERSSTSRLFESVDQMFRLPLEMSSATWDLMMEGMERMSGRSWGTRSEKSGSNADDDVTPWDDQDMGGDDLKYVTWSIVFTKPDYEAVLEPQHEEIVNYSTDGTSFAAMKIAKFLEKARHGRAPKPEVWAESYPAAPSRDEKPGGAPGATQHEKGWRIPPDDEKYIRFIYRVDRRLSKQEDEVERVTVERNGTTRTVKIV